VLEGNLCIDFRVGRSQIGTNTKSELDIFPWQREASSLEVRPLGFLSGFPKRNS